MCLLRPLPISCPANIVGGPALGPRCMSATSNGRCSDTCGPPRFQRGHRETDMGICKCMRTCARLLAAVRNVGDHPCGVAVQGADELAPHGVVAADAQCHGRAGPQQRHTAQIQRGLRRAVKRVASHWGMQATSTNSRDSENWLKKHYRGAPWRRRRTTRRTADEYPPPHGPPERPSDGTPELLPSGQALRSYTPALPKHYAIFEPSRSRDRPSPTTNLANPPQMRTLSVQTRPMLTKVGPNRSNSA